MTRLIPLALLLVITAAAIRLNEQRLAALPDTDGPDELSLLVFSRGRFQTLRTQDPLYTRYGIDDGLITLDEVFRIKEPGLRAALFDANFKLIEYRNFPLATDVHAARAFLSFCAGRPTTSVLVLHHKGSLLPADGTPSEDRDGLADLARGWGVEPNPFTQGQASWCLVHPTGRMGTGTVAEARSDQTNVALAVTLTKKDMYRQGPSVRSTPRAEGALTLHLKDELDTADHRVGTVWIHPGATLPGGTMDAVRAMPPNDPEAGRIVPHEVTWRGLHLPEGTRFSAHVALNPAARATSDGVDFVLLLDHQEVARFPCPMDDAAFTWRAFEASLPAKTYTDLTLKVDTRESGLGDYAMWGDPVLLVPAAP